MAGFDVLHRDLSLDHNYFLEASAGTGKTFAIEHLFLRLLIEKEEMSVDKILVVTFTKAATHELKRRIRATLEKTLLSLEEGKNLPDFLQAIIEKGDSPLYLTKKKILRALSLFDEVKIFTIHGFCYSTLTEELEGQKEETREETVSYLRDFLRTELPTFLTPSQLDKLLRHYRNDVEKLVSALISLLLRKAPIHSGVDREAIQNSLLEIANELKMQEDFPKVLEDLSLFASLYKGMCSKDGSLKEEVFEELQWMENFQKQDPFSYSFLAQMTQDKRLLRKKEPSYSYPELIKKIEQNLIPLLHKGLDSETLFAYVAEKACHHVEGVLESEKILVTEDILLVMEKKLSDPLFVASIQNAFKAVLIDEFQDTDRTQWRIFKKLFLNKLDTSLFLIGDPKQSIYRFRGGDIYTYFQAKKEFGEAFHGELSCNFRSDPELVEALNSLFSLTTPFQTLPSTGEALDYSKVHADPNKTGFVWRDGKKALHFFEAEEEEQIFNAMVEEIQYLHREYQFPYRECAVLVNDRYQAERFQKCAKKHSLHACSKKSRPLTESLAYPALMELLEGVLFYKNESSLMKALGGAIFSYSYDQLEEEKKKWVTSFSHLKEKLEGEGILPFFKELMEGCGLYEKLFQRPLGGELYFDLLQLCEILASTCSADNVVGAERYLTLLKNLNALSSEDESIQAHPFSLEEAVPILTIHGSKGLEFEIVLVPGVIAPQQEKKGLVFDPEKRAFYLDESRREKEKEELQAEKMRTFYVAATRAKKRVYLPIIEGDRESVMGIFAEKTKLKEKLPTLPFSLSKAVEKRVLSAPLKEAPLKTLYPPSTILLSIPSLPISSFSRLATTSHSEKISTPSTPHLPLGAETGTLFHTILEKLPWTTLTKASLHDLQSLILPFIEGSSYMPFLEALAAPIFDAFQAPLPVEPTFSLNRVDPAKVFREMEFLYFSDKRQCYLKGFIDLLFEFDKKLYLVDWKSNYLENYSRESIEGKMRVHDYFLQKEIYQEALKKYSSLFGHYEIGGCFYIFLRSTNLKDGDGIFFS